MNNDDQNTNAEYEELEVLNEIDGKDGEPLDPIEQNQDATDIVEDNEGAREELSKAISGDDDDEDAIGDE